jgi:LacI family transcriptional regulator
MIDKHKITRGKNMKPKLEDVAKQAGVSLATVSRVLNNHPVREETREKVQLAIAEFNYRPNLAARSLTQKRSQTIGIVASSLVNPYHATLVHEMEGTLRAAGYLSIICSSNDSPETEAAIIHSMLDSQVDGIIVAEATPLNTNNGFYREIDTLIPLILINGNPETSTTSQVMVDQQMGMRSAMEYLFSLGHIRIAMLRGRYSPSYDIKEQTYRQMMAAREYEIPSAYILNIKEANQISAIAEAEQGIASLLASDDKTPTAIFASNEFLATGAIRAILNAGLRVPQDISILAQDNSYISSITNPTITCINMKMPLIGKASAEMLLQLLESNIHEARRLTFYPELIIRESTAVVAN